MSEQWQPPAAADARQRAGPRLLMLAICMLCLGGGRAHTVDPHPLAEAAFGIGNIDSFLVQQDGELLIEAYRGGMSAHRTTNIKSASKSILSLLIGIAIEEGYLAGVDQTIGGFFPEYFNAHPAPEKQAITIENLLTMQAGLASTSRRNSYGAWVLSDDWTAHALGRRLETEPGGRMVYSTGSSHLLSVILTRASGMSTRDFARRYLFGPMDIHVGGWDRDPQGYYMGGNNVALSPRSLLKIGQLVLNGGVYNGRRLVPEQWLERSMRPYGRSNYNHDYYYGYMWWQSRIGAYQVRFAWGNGGQYIMLLPALGTVLAITSRASAEVDRSSRGSRRQLFRFMGTDLIPWLEDRRRSPDQKEKQQAGGPPSANTNL